MKNIGGLKPCRWCVFISGRGSNLAASLEGMRESGAHEIELVVSSAENVAGLAKAKRSGVPVMIAPKTAGGKIDWDQLTVDLKRRKIDMIFLLGFMKIVPGKFIDQWANRILNLHPSLLPAYPGLNSIERAFVAGSELGASVHLVVPQVDAGRVLKQRRSLEAASGNERHSMPFAIADFLVHVDEQRLVKNMVQRPYAVWTSSEGSH
ncbi:MAG: formyltransferase family protein [Bdellovibrionales bacterium]|nr:formyltransferase family protein [Bdellovibrionales bacterium]